MLFIQCLIYDTDVRYYIFICHLSDLILLPKCVTNFAYEWFVIMPLLNELLMKKVNCPEMQIKFKYYAHLSNFMLLIHYYE